MNNASMQNVLSQCLPQYTQLHPLSPAQANVVSHIQQCRTPVLGGMKWQCDTCDYQLPVYHSCRDRHCPQCQKIASEKWCEQQRQSVLPTPYFHTVFTLPHQLNGWVELHPDLIYSLIFRAVWKTLSTFGANPKRLGGQMGMSAILHTWGQNLYRHVHLHCLIPGGALDKTGQWIDVKSKTYLFPDKAMARYFRGAMVTLLRQAYQDTQLFRITRDNEVKTCLDALMAVDWIVYTKSYIKSPETVVDYLGRYTHRIAISDRRISRVNHDSVAFRYKDYRDHSKNKVMVLETTEFLRRFLLHVLPSGFKRIRHYGFLSNRSRKDKLIIIRQSISEKNNTVVETQPDSDRTKITRPLGEIEFQCPRCKVGLLKPKALSDASDWESG